MKQISITAVIPFFNREKTLGQCLKSILAQTYSVSEIICVDDGSTDGSVRMIESFGDPRIKILKNSRGKGAQGARNTGIRAAKGEWIAFHDSDDVWLPTKLQKQTEALLSAGFDPFVMVYCDYSIVHEDTGRRDYCGGATAEGVHAYADLLCGPSPGFPAILTSKIALEKIGYLDEKVPSYQEWDTALALAKVCQVVRIPEALFDYHLHGGDTISKSGRRALCGYQYVIEKYGDDIVSFCGDACWQKHMRVQFKEFLGFVSAGMSWKDDAVIVAILEKIFATSSDDLARHMMLPLDPGIRETWQRLMGLLAARLKRGVGRKE